MGKPITFRFVFPLPLQEMAPGPIMEEPTDLKELIQASRSAIAVRILRFRQ